MNNLKLTGFKYLVSSIGVVLKRIHAKFAKEQNCKRETILSLQLYYFAGFA